MILTTGKGPFLEFLRNLTPQILLFSVALVLTVKLDLNKVDLENWRATLPFLAMISIFVCAAMANVLNFIEASCRSFSPIDEESKRLKKEGITGFRHFNIIWKMLWKKSKWAIVEMLIAIFVVQVGWGAVIVASITSAAKLYMTMHGGGTTCE